MEYSIELSLLCKLWAREEVEDTLWRRKHESVFCSTYIFSFRDQIIILTHLFYISKELGILGGGIQLRIKSGQD